MRRANSAQAALLLLVGGRVQASVGFLLGKERAEAAVALGAILNRLFGHVALVVGLVQVLAGLLRLVDALGVVGGWRHGGDFLPLDVELAQLAEVVNEQVVQLDGLLGLLESVLVPVDLREDRAELHLQPPDYHQLPHSIAD